MRWLGVSLVVASWLLVGSARADDKPDKQRKADQLFEQGRTLLNDAGDDKAKVKIACDKFVEAIRLDPEAPGTMLNLGLCNEKLDKYRTALYWFRKAQARASETNLPTYENAAKDHTIALANLVATIKIGFSEPPPNDIRVKIDGEEVAAADYLRAEVDAGHHTLVAGAAGYKIVHQEFDVTLRGGNTITLDLVKGDNAVIVDRGKGRRHAAIYTAIGGGVLLLTSGGVSLYAQSKYNQCVDDKKLIDPDKIMPTGSCPEKDVNSATDYANHYRNLARYVGTTFFAVGTVAIGVAAYLYYTAPDKERVDRTVFVPTLGPEQVGFAVSRDF